MAKKLITAGGTGLIGKALINEARRRGYSVVNISRDPRKAKFVLPPEVENISFGEWKNLASDALDGAAIANLSGESVMGRWTKSKKREILRSRKEATRILVDKINSSSPRPSVFVSASAVGYYGDRRDEIDESAAAGSDFLAKVCAEWEKEAARVEKTRLAIARVGLVLSQKGGALPKMAAPYKFFLGGKLGDGKNWLPWIHIDDLTRAIFFAIETENFEGPFNCVAPKPEKSEDFAKKLGEALKRPSFFSVPPLVLKIVLGEASDLVLKGQKAVPKKLLENGFEFKFVELKEALKALLAN